MGYLIDSNVFIDAKNRHYGFDFCPAFWGWLLRANEAGTVFSIEKVEDELLAGSDELAAWAGDRGPGFFLKPDAAMLHSLGRVSAWAASQAYTASAVSDFLGKADFYLVSHALAHGHVVVTHEVPSNSPRRIKIPEPCIALGVKAVQPFEMLRREHARFVLGMDAPATRP